MATLEERFQSRQPVLARLGRLDANGVPLPIQYMQEFAPDMERIINEACFGYLWNRPGLSMEQRSLATMSIITVLRRDINLKGHIESGLAEGFSPAQIAEIMIQLLFYTGAPIANTGLRIATDVFKERGLQGSPYQVHDPSEDPEELYRRGLAMRRQVLGDTVTGHLENADQVDRDWERYLLEYLWGSVWPRPGLDLQSRCICTLAALTLVGTERAIRDYVGAALRLGLTENQVKELFFHLTFYIGLSLAQRAAAIANEVFSSR